jgi:hypothetical protein
MEKYKFIITVHDVPGDEYAEIVEEIEEAVRDIAPGSVDVGIGEPDE